LNSYLNLKLKYKTTGGINHTINCTIQKQGVNSRIELTKEYYKCRLQISLSLPYAGSNLIRSMGIISVSAKPRHPLETLQTYEKGGNKQLIQNE